jgi:hypothetical protein
MINFPAGLRKHLKFLPHFRIGLKTQIALLCSVSSACFLWVPFAWWD